MQQLNILPINVSQKVDIKDESSALTLTSTKEIFSQHVDQHLAKNKGSVNDDSQSRVTISKSKTVENTTQASEETSDDRETQTSPSSLTNGDVADTATGEQEVAASGKKDDQSLTLSPTETAGETKEQVDESDLLMSFLLKADNTLAATKLHPSLKNSEMSAEQMANYEAQLLLKSSGLVADLSAITQALNTSPALDSSQLKQAAQALHQTAEHSKTKGNSAQVALALNALLEGEGIDEQDALLTKATTPNADSIANTKVEILPQSSVNKLAGNNEAEIMNQEQAKSAAQKLTDEQLINQEVAKASLLTSEEKQDKHIYSSQSQALKQQLTSPMANNAASKEQELAKSVLSDQGVISSQQVVETEQSTLKKMTALAGNSPSGDQGKVERLASTTIGTDITSHHKALSQQALAQAQAAQDNKVAAQTNLSSSGQSVDLTAVSTQLDSSSVEHEIAKSKGVSLEKNTDIGKQNVATASADFSIHSDLADITSRASQASQHLADQQANDIFNPRASSEISQSQKTNTQLHNETISIFRKDFADAVKDKVMLVISQKLQQFDITLDPPELGNIHVKVNLQGEQASVNFVVNNQQAKDAFEQNMHKLKELLAEQGVDVGDTNVEQQSQQSDNQGMNEENNNHSDSITMTADASDAIVHDLSARMIKSSTSAVDYYA
ncbi:flagellar hook-length control protein FliK [Colwellia sp. KU-HH00111]|uniref:flagellar hook-length control protein FliK n=1 Tax=Colwellia sp. KU-HH00111 TaxID=3127652 RepID=UPI003104C35A